MIEDARFVHLSDAERGYLSDASFLPADLNSSVAEALERTDGPSEPLIIATDIVERLRSAFTERLAKVGFDENYDLTSEGVRLEGLIDAFFSGAT